jgi:hypothetical protein
VAIDPKRSIPLFAGLPTLPSEMALPQRQDFPVHVPDYKKDMERLKQDCLGAEEIARPYARFMALQELSPT